jgi:hypothetical protein
MPYLNWETDLKFVDSQASFESEHWNFADMFLEYFKKRWKMEQEKLHETENTPVENSSFIYAPTSAKQKCSALIHE